MHRLGLADAVRARDGLEVDLRVVVALEHDDGRRRRQVDAEAAGARRDEEDLERRFLALEEADVKGTTRARRLAVEAGVCRCEERVRVSSTSWPLTSSREREKEDEDAHLYERRVM